MNSKITFDIPSHEIDSAKTLVETIDSVELSKREKVVQTYYKNNFKTICNVVIYDIIMRREDNSSDQRAISAALMTVRSDVLAKSYQYDGKVSIPKIICDIIDFKHIIIKDQLIIDTLYYGNIYNVELPKIDYDSLSISDLLYYADNYGCGNIHLSQFEKLKNIISIFVMQLLTPLGSHCIYSSYYADVRRGVIAKCTQNCISNRKCNMQCKNQSCLDGKDCPRSEYNFDKHKKTCCLFIKGVLVADFTTNVMKQITYVDLLKTYCKLVIPYGSSDVTGSKYITTNMSDVKNKVILTNNTNDSDYSLKFMI
jgi:hypothetical protein